LFIVFLRDFSDNVSQIDAEDVPISFAQSIILSQTFIIFPLISISATHLPLRTLLNENPGLFSKYLQTNPYALFRFNLQHSDIFEEADKFNSFLISSKQSQILT
jgi:hypothetical protein